MKGLLTLILVLSTLASHARVEEREVDGVPYRFIRAQASEIRIVWKDDDGRQLRTFKQAHSYLASLGKPPLAITNGGIFEPQEIPSGLLIQQGKELRPINRREGDGNFFLKPNGIFLITSQGPAVIDSREYPLPDVSVIHAVQSGPLLLRRGKIHPEFRANSTSRLVRNGVGVTKDGTVILAITRTPSTKLPNLHEFASFFVALGCSDALFLDGSISQLRTGDALTQPGGSFGSFVAVINEKAEE